MGNVIMKARQIQHGATNVEEALNLLSPQELIEMGKRMDAIEAWKSKVRDSVNTGSNMYVIDNALKVPVKALILNLLPIQSGSGDPSPTNVRPISGRTAVNLGRTAHNVWDGQWRNGYYDLSTGAFVSLATAVASKNPTAVLSNTTYRFVTGDSNNVAFVFFYKANGDFISALRIAGSGDFTTPTDTAYIHFNYNASPYGDTYKNDTAINYPSTVTAYEPYMGQTITIALGTTVYGGTLNVKRGVLTITDVYKKFTTNDTWTQGATAGERKRFLHVLSPEIATPAVVPSIDGLYCSILKPQTADGDYICRYLTNSRFDVILPNSANVSTVDEMKQWAATNELEIAYPLATPTTVQLTGEELEMLKGYNLISTDADSMDVTALVLGGEA